MSETSFSASVVGSATRSCGNRDADNERVRGNQRDVRTALFVLDETAMRNTRNRVFSAMILGLVGCAHASVSTQREVPSLQRMDNVGDGDLCTQPGVRAELPAAGPLTTMGGPEVREPWAGASIHYANHFAGFDSAQSVFATCGLGECTLTRGDAVERVAFESEGDGTQSAELVRLLTARGFSLHTQSETGRARMWLLGRELVIEVRHVGTACETESVSSSSEGCHDAVDDLGPLDVSLKEPSTGAFVVLAHDDDPSALLWSATPTHDGMHMGIAIDTRLHGLRGVVVDLRSAARAVYKRAAQTAWAQHQLSAARQFCARSIAM